MPTAKTSFKRLPQARELSNQQESSSAKHAAKLARRDAALGRRLLGLNITDTYQSGGTYDVTIDAAKNTADIARLSAPLDETGCLNLTGTHGTTLTGESFLCNKAEANPVASRPRTSHINWPTQSPSANASAPAPINATVALMATLAAVAFPPAGR